MGTEVQEMSLVALSYVALARRLLQMLMTLKTASQPVLTKALSLGPTRWICAKNTNFDHKTFRMQMAMTWRSGLGSNQGDDYDQLVRIAHRLTM